ncbi:SRPBCC family protein [Pseudoduganella plicata]|uniref:Vanillate O-demethylase oxidoreductase VanB n=1 Tax=Pseudoduganella plicata TaxID=321984 RepID=A0A4P7BEJ9_9BURK|nr:SRPBCC family protein [Pseudoduganella plicata]QBQ35749.1 vanillate O-demethylase oxidoreductase VanB [Pseudoduganella plicata]GGY95400.1 hypothetical protein GCM10007388_30950 [Pseudoduganella plicata]
MTASDCPDRIERSIRINGTRDKVWRALTDAGQFGAWFGADLSGNAFVPGQRVRGPMTVPGYEHLFFDAVTERVEPQELMSFRWHPYSGDPGSDYAGEQPTLVTFTLQDLPGEGILLTVVESGFALIPAHRRANAFASHEGGWDAQLNNIATHVANDVLR